ncbi:MAG: hydrogenase expression/formation protein HypE [Bacteroidota bacterium]
MSTEMLSSPKIRMQLACPMPKLDFDVITLGHGSGGVLTHQLLESGVFDLLKNEHLDRRHDGALLHMSGPLAFSTDSFVISPIFFPGGDIGELAVHGTVNDLAMCGAIPRYLSLSFIIEEGLAMADFWKLLVSIKYACEQAGVSVVTGDTKVVERGKGDQIFINTSGVGEIHPNAQIDPSRVQKGDCLIVSGPIATHGIAIMSQRQGIAFETDLLSDTRPLNHQVKSLLDEFGDAIHLFRDPTRGGLASSLNEIAEDTRLGVSLNQAAFPIIPQVAGACEMLGLDPLYVANEGIFLAWVAAEQAEACLAALRQLPHGEEAAIIGQMVSDHPGKVLLNSSIGGRRVVNKIIGEQLPRIC